MIEKLVDDPSELVRSVSFAGLVERGLEKYQERVVVAVKEDDPVVARAISMSFIPKNPQILIDMWKVRELNLKNELWLDLTMHSQKVPMKRREKSLPPMPLVILVEFMHKVYTGVMLVLEN